MKTLIVTSIVTLILLPSAFACDRTQTGGLRVGALAATVVRSVPLTASLTADGVKAITQMITSFGTHLPCHASHLPRMAVNATNKSAEKAKATASEGMSGFSNVSSIFLRIAYSFFSALASGILRS